jgi:hypothetical protein
MTATAVCDWSIQAGDIISLMFGEETYALPVYRQTITWNGAARVVYENSGAANRQVMDAENRRIYQQKRAMHELTVNVNGYKIAHRRCRGQITTLELTTDGLKMRWMRIN